MGWGGAQARNSSRGGTAGPLEERTTLPSPCLDLTARVLVPGWGPAQIGELGHH